MDNSLLLKKIEYLEKENQYLKRVLDKAGIQYETKAISQEDKDIRHEENKCGFMRTYA